MSGTGREPLGPSDLVVIVTAGAEPRAVASSRLLVRPSTATDSLVVAVSDYYVLLVVIERELTVSLTVADAEVLVGADVGRAALAFAEAVAPDVELNRRGGGGARAARDVRGCPVRRRGEARRRDYVAGSNQHAADGGRAARFASACPHGTSDFPAHE